ncbi:MAG: hypothetical protein NTV80_13345 [Verrucomicrobia bacterium]|jgi:hypothetical protein|nr:hypothetical protein [Verrucomicrobiota bacterium]
MRSQKQSNRAPRPFKNQNSTKGWSGGGGGFIPAPKVNHLIKKIAPKPQPSAPENGDSSDAAKS